MIIPTPDFDPLFAEDGIPFGLKMRQFIQREFADQLGPYTALLEAEEGLAVVAARFFPECAANASQRDAA